MKKTFIYFLPAIFCVAGLASCKKGEAPTAKPVEDNSIYHETFITNDQVVMTSVKDATLTMVYYENISLIFGAAGYDQSWAVHLYENLSGSSLNGFDYTTTTPAGDVTFDWVDDNLNNVSLKTIKDTTINGKAMVSINVHRPFTFVKKYADAQSAVNEQQILLNTTTDKVNFSSDVFFGTNYPKYTTSAKIVYKSQK